ncbi:MAG: class I mannose-6-phosphate isomerase [Planctomycetota bacterium]|nr:MAG: class I mannose-6-phosphate isomerase [Planctomycetota bacterium]
MRPGPLKLRPIPVARPWGGDVLVQRFGKPRPPDGGPLGESWEASGVAGRESVVAEGPYAGRRVTEVLGAPLPLLIKLIDARQWLSVQVHPDERAAREIGGGAAPKTEAWHILDAAPGAEIIHGMRPGATLTDLLAACATGELDSVVRRQRVHTGDTVNVPAGTLHAIGPGLVLYEVQQPSDTTYRVYDWGRGRELHLVQAARALAFEPIEHPVLHTALSAGPNPRIPLLANERLRLELILVDRGERVIYDRDAITFLTVIAGGGELLADAGSLALATGDTLAIPPGVDYCLRPGTSGLRALRAGPALRRRSG